MPDYWAMVTSRWVMGMKLQGTLRSVQKADLYLSKMVARMNDLMMGQLFRFPRQTRKDGLLQEAMAT
jgi:hypothetical protein